MGAAATAAGLGSPPAVAVSRSDDAACVVALLCIEGLPTPLPPPSRLPQACPVGAATHGPGVGVDGGRRVDAGGATHGVGRTTRLAAERVIVQAVRRAALQQAAGRQALVGERWRKLPPPSSAASCERTSCPRPAALPLRWACHAARCQLGLTWLARWTGILPGRQRRNKRDTHQAVGTKHPLHAAVIGLALITELRCLRVALACMRRRRAGGSGGVVACGC